MVTATASNAHQARERRHGTSRILGSLLQSSRVNLFLRVFDFRQPHTHRRTCWNRCSDLIETTTGRSSPHEVTALSRPFLEKICKESRLSLDRPNSVERLQQAAKRFFAVKNGVDDDKLDPDTVPKTGIVPIGPMEHESLLPEFGVPLEADYYPIQQDDLDHADRTMARCDRNRDGYMDRVESQRGSWNYRDPFDDDLDGDERLTRMELAIRYARRRHLEQSSGELYRQAVRTRSMNPRSVAKRPEPERKDKRRLEDQRALTDAVMERFDANRNGRINSSEAVKLGIPFGQIDGNRDAELSRDEIYDYFVRLHEISGPKNDFPEWFIDRDSNRDKQISMVEFSEQWTDEQVLEFTSYDQNSDGVITESEMRSSASLVGGEYRNRTAEAIPPRKMLLSEIEVTDDYLVGDINVELSITHSHCEHLEAYLIGPNGEKIELFTHVGGHGDHFDKTILDDQSRYPIIKSKPPFRGVFHPKPSARGNRD